RRSPLRVYVTPPTAPALSPLPLHDALPISHQLLPSSMCSSPRHPQLSPPYNVFHYQTVRCGAPDVSAKGHYVRCRPFLLPPKVRSEEHTSELQSRFDLVCRLLLEKKKRRGHDGIVILLRVILLGYLIILSNDVYPKFGNGVISLMHVLCQRIDM